MTETIRALLETLRLAERLKFELRHAWTSEGRRESVAEHTYQMALMAVLLHPYLEHPVDLGHTLQLVILHDLVEAEAGDVVYFDANTTKAEKAAREQAAIEHLRAMLPEPVGQQVYEAWHEFEAGATGEARFAKALDNLEVQVQHNLASIDTWEEIEYALTYSKTGRYAQHDAFLQAFAAAVIAEGEKKMIEAGLDVAAIRERAAASDV